MSGISFLSYVGSPDQLCLGPGRRPGHLLIEMLEERRQAPRSKTDVGSSGPRVVRSEMEIGPSQEMAGSIPG